MQVIKLQVWKRSNSVIRKKHFVQNPNQLLEGSFDILLGCNQRSKASFRKKHLVFIRKN